MKKRSKEMQDKVRETAYDLLMEHEGNEMLCADLAELVNNFFRHSINGKALGMILRTQVNAGTLIKRDARSGGNSERYWKLEPVSKEVFLNPPKHG